MEDIPLGEIEMLVMMYSSAYAKQSQVSEPPQEHVLAVQDLGDAFDMVLVSPRQPSQQCHFRQSAVSCHMFRECPQFVETIKTGLAYRTESLIIVGSWTDKSSEMYNEQLPILNKTSLPIPT